MGLPSNWICKFSGVWPGKLAKRKTEIFRIHESSNVILSPRWVETGGVMMPRTQEPSSSDDLFRSRLEDIINLRHELALLDERIDWAK